MDLVHYFSHTSLIMLGRYQQVFSNVMRQSDKEKFESRGCALLIKLNGKDFSIALEHFELKVSFSLNNILG